MNIAVWDTYIERTDGLLMHFDILVDDEQNKDQVLAFGSQYLATKDFETSKITSNKCNFCHLEKANQQLENEITLNGYAIIEMENCF